MLYGWGLLFLKICLGIGGHPEDSLFTLHFFHSSLFTLHFFCIFVLSHECIRIYTRAYTLEEGRK